MVFIKELRRLMNPALFFEEFNPYKNYDFNATGKIQLMNMKNKLLVNRKEREKPITDVYLNTREVDGIHRTISRLNRNSPLNKDYQLSHKYAEDLDDSFSRNETNNYSLIRKINPFKSDLESSQQDLSVNHRPRFIIEDERFRVLYKKYNREKNTLRQQKKRAFFEQGSEIAPYMITSSREEKSPLKKTPPKAKVDTGRFDKNRMRNLGFDREETNENLSQEKFKNKLYQLYKVSMIGIKDMDENKIKKFKNSRSQSPTPINTKRDSILELPQIKQK